MVKLRSTKEKIEGLEKILHTEGSDKKLGYEEWKTELLKYVPTVSKRTGPIVFPLKSEPFIPSTGNFQGVIFHPCMVCHINFTTIS